MVEKAAGDSIAKRLVIICLTGMPGAGKSTVASSLKEKGFLVITMGDVIREEAIRLNLDLNDTNLGRLMVQLREEFGPGAVAELVVKKIDSTLMSNRNGGNTVLIVDGIRSIAEVTVLNRVGRVRLLAIHASSRVRFVHLKERGRTDAPLAQSDFMERERRELDVGISEVIALADEVISNNRLTIGELKANAVEIVMKWVNSLKLDS
ncbi:MAG: AAA family ATPase [Nitrososphaeraceae archaeon]